MKPALDILTTAPEFDLVVTVVGSSARFYPDLAVRPIIDSAGAEKPIATFLVPEAPQARAELGKAGVANFYTPEACADAVAAALSRRPPRPLPAARVRAAALRRRPAARRARGLWRARPPRRAARAVGRARHRRGAAVAAVRLSRGREGAVGGDFAQVGCRRRRARHRRCGGARRRDGGHARAVAAGRARAGAADDPRCRRSPDRLPRRSRCGPAGHAGGGRHLHARSIATAACASRRSISRPPAR